MARTTATDVKAITLSRRGGDAADSTLDVSVFIEVASIVVDRVMACANADDYRTVPSDAEAELIERYLAAHFWAVDDQQFTSKKTERASATFGGETGKRFDWTAFGQHAMAVDPSGCLENMNKTRVHARVTWLGKEPSNQTNYMDRD